MSDLKYYLKGVFDGDGHYNKKSRYISINLIDFDLLEYIKRSIKEVYQKDVNIINHSKAKGNSKEQRRINFFPGPDKFYELLYLEPKTKQQKIEYLKGMFDAEGHVGFVDRPIERNGKEYVGHDKKLIISQKSHKELDKYYKWLKDLEIESNKLYRDDTRSHLEIRKNDSIRKFNDLIGFRIERKQEVLDHVVSYLAKWSRVSPEEKAGIISVYKNTNFGASFISKMFGKKKSSIRALLRRAGVVLNKSNRGGLITYNDIDFAESVIGKELPFSIPYREMKKFSPKNTPTSKIVSIKKHTTTKGVDLNTPKYNNFFLSNGILSHNSFLAMQIGMYWAYMMRKRGYNIPYTLDDNIVFDGQKLISQGNRLGQNHPFSPLVFDEAGADLQGSKAMKATTQAVKDYLRECGQYNMLTILVLPDFFDLPKGTAVNRTNCLIDVYSNADENGYFRRGLCKFYSKTQKKWLYLNGKRTLNYGAAKPDFYADFTKFLPFEEKDYREKKRQALRAREETSQDKKLLQRNVAWYLLVYEAGMSRTEIARRTTNMGAYTIQQTITEALKGMDLGGNIDEEGTSQ